MKKAKIFLPVILFFLLLKPLPVWAENLCPQNACENISDLTQKVQCLLDATEKCGKQRVDLTSQINYMDTQIKLTTTKIYQTQNQILQLDDQIASLSGQIGRLENSLGDLSKILLERIVQTYKKGDPSPFYLLLSANKFSDLLSRLKYLRLVQAHDKKLMFAMQQTKDNYTDQKQAREDKKKQLDNLKIILAQQKIDLGDQQQAKKNLLAVTQNDEQKYQSLLDQAKRELQGLITSIFSEKRHVKKGDIIGLMGNTGFSTGPHLHFGVYNLSESNAAKFDYYSGVENPLNYLSSKNVLFDKFSCDDVSSSQNKTIGSGSWNWPMNDPTISQCFDHTPYSYVYPGNFHHGLDMYNNNDIYIRAAEEGEAYFYRSQQGSFGNNVRIFHSDGKMTLYLHMQ